MPHTQFTVEQANRTLPLVRRIVEDIVIGYRRWRMRIDEFEVASINSRPDAQDARAGELESEALALAAEITAYEAELAQIGVRCTDHAVGLVDFPGEIDGRRVHLSWRLGEAAVQHWHEIGAGHAARRPLPSRAA
jgi:hypothetical protein